MSKCEYVKLTKKKRRLYIMNYLLKIFIMIALVAFSDMLIISGMRTIYKNDIVMYSMIIGIRAIIIIAALYVLINYIIHIVGFARNKYVLRKYIDDTNPSTYRESIIHINKIPNEKRDELFK